MAPIDAGKCDACGYQLDAVSVVGEEDTLPQDGDVSVCMKCGALRYFVVKDGHIGRRMPTEEEFAVLGADPGLQKLERIRALVAEGAWDQHHQTNGESNEEEEPVQDRHHPG